jgi:soluble lytic murein transglycosylase-like protein
MNSRFWFSLAAGTCAWLSIVGSAEAEIVLLTSGRTLQARSHRIDGDTIVLQLRNGGEVTCDRSLIEKIVEDEVPYEEPQAVSRGDATPAPAPGQSLAPAVPYADLITSLAQAQGIDPMLVSALIKVESNYHPRARSHKGAMGLMQLMPATARQYNLRNPYDPRANVAAGVKHLKSLIDRWGVELALAAYNAGEEAVKRFNGVPPYRETRSYVSRILSLARLE